MLLFRFFSREVIIFRRFKSTIFAQSSGFGKCGVSVIRVSGPAASESLLAVAGFSKLPKPRQAILRNLKDPGTQETLDKGLVLWFPGPKSFTGEDCVEYHVHGSVAVIGAVLNTLGRFANHRPAMAGEFTKRAFLSGKLDLTRVEGLGDLIHAETEMQRKQALRQMEGDLYRVYESWKKRLIRILARIEAVIDFSETEDLNPNLEDEVKAGIRILISDLNSHLRDVRSGDLLRNGVRVVIVGKPNVGKSSLINLLIQRPVAIISAIPGTTRDVLTANLNLGGFPVILSDTAGIRESNDSIEKEGILRAKSEAQNADLIIRVRDVTSVIEGDDNEDLYFTHGPVPPVLEVVNKIDLRPDTIIKPGTLPISVTNGVGIDEFIDVLTDKVRTLCISGIGGDSPSLTRQRHKTHLKKASTFLNKSLSQDLLENADLTAHYCRLAVTEIEYITGKIDPEKIFDVIFADFCIGK